MSINKSWLPLKCSVVSLFVLCLLVACASQQEKSQSLAQQIIDQTTPPQDSQLLNVRRISHTEGYPVFGVGAIYGTQQDYFPNIYGYYQNFLDKHGWLESAPNADGSPNYCNPKYDHVYLTFDILLVNDPRQLIPTSIPSETLGKYRTIYDLYVYQMPSDTEKCKRFDEGN